jgi:hypothetical protein
MQAMDDDRLERLLLCDEPTLRAVAAWVSLPKADEDDQDGEDDLDQWGDAPIWYSLEEWAECTGLPTAAMAIVRTRLASMEIIDQDGEPWPPALTLARNLAATKIKRRKTTP